MDMVEVCSMSGCSFDEVFNTYCRGHLGSWCCGGGCNSQLLVKQANGK